MEVAAKSWSLGRALRLTGGVRGVARGAVLALAAGWLCPAAVAQSSEMSWMDQIPGFGRDTQSQRAAQSGPRERVKEQLNDLRPGNIPFRSEEMLGAMEKAIAEYQRIVAAGGWKPVPGSSNRTIRPGDDDERIPHVRRRLRASGDLVHRAGGSYESFTYDGELDEAVRRFQERNGLRVSGRIDQPTLAAMNVSAQARLAQLQTNLQRLRELQAGRIEDRYILVNIPAFQLEAVEKYEVQQRHRVIVGREQRQTPTLKATIKGLNFFPYWRVPESVAHLDLIPRLQKEPEYLDKEGIRVYNGFNGPELTPMSVDWRNPEALKYKFRQDPGPRNALGLVRIDMPNEHTVYMHDTPMKQLFDSRQRPFSAGCVRVQDVFKLVAWIARDEQGGWTEQRVDDVIQQGQALDVNLARPLPVYFAYITAWAEPSTGRVEFRPDLYGRDGSRDLAGERDPDAPPPPSGVQALAP